MEWIPVNDQLPENLQKVLACDMYGEVYKLHFNNNFGNQWKYVVSGDGIYVSLTIHNVTHWMPLPEPPKTN
jgi:hypothetical protein